MRGVLSTMLALAMIGCAGAAPRAVTSVRVQEPTPPVSRFADHGPVTLRSRSVQPQPPFYVELAADGSITGTRCGATRFTDDGTLEREGQIVARMSRPDDVIVISDADGAPLGWTFEASALVAGGTRFELSDGTITPADPQLPTITVDPPTAPPRLVLALFATLLVCDDVGP